MVDPSSLGELTGALAHARPFEQRGVQLQRELRTLLCALARHARFGPDGPLMVLLFGGANTGKSSLFNSLVGRDLSIAHAIAGSTRHLLVHAPPPAAEALLDAALWPDPHRPHRLEKREALEEEVSPRRVYVAQGDAPAHALLIDSPDITTAHAENARLTGQALLLADVVVLVLTEEQHADRVLIDHFPAIRDLAKHPIIAFNRVSTVTPEEHGSYQKFRTLWLENRMGGLPEKFFLPRLAPVRVAQQMQKEPAFQALSAHLEKLDRRALLEQTQAGLVVAARQRGRELVTQMAAERAKVAQALDDLRARYRALLKEYNARRRWASRMLQVRSWLQSTIGAISPSTTAAAHEAHELTQRRFWQLILTPLMGQDDRPSALEGLELMAEALENDPHPAPLFRPFSRLTQGVTSLIFGKPVAGRDTDPPSLIDALELLEKARCAFVAHEVLPRSLGADWQGALPTTDQPAVDPKTELERAAQEYRDIGEQLKTRIREIIARDPEVRARLSKRHARIALAAGITFALALIDMGHSALAVGVGLSTPVLWELMDWAAGQPDLNTALYLFEHKKAMWLERAFQRHVTGPLWDSLVDMEARLDPGALEMALRHSGMETSDA